MTPSSVFFIIRVKRKTGRLFIKYYRELRMIDKEFFAKSGDKNKEKINKIVSFLEKYAFKDCNLKDIIEKELNCNWCTTRAIFRRFTGKTIQEVHDIFILERTKKYLLSEEKCVYIAIKLGFRDESYFCKWFKKKTGKTPTEYRTEKLELQLD